MSQKIISKNRVNEPLGTMSSSLLLVNRRNNNMSTKNDSSSKLAPKVEKILGQLMARKDNKGDYLYNFYL